MATKGGYALRDFSKGETWANPWTYIDPLNLGSFFDPAQVDVPDAGTSGSRTNMYDPAARRGLDSIQYGAGNATAAKQAELNRLLLLQAQGGGVNPAQLEFQKNLDSTNAQQIGAINSVRGISPALQAEMIARGATGLRMQGARDAAIMRANQILASQGLASQALSATRSGDISQQGADTSTLNTVGGLKYGQDSLSMQDQWNRMNAAQRANEFNATQQQQANASRMQFTSSVIGALAGTGGYMAMGGGGGNMPRDDWAPMQLPAPGQNRASSALGFPGDPPPYMADGGMVPNYTEGGKIPGRAKIPGDSLQNDTIDIKASPGEFMLPRSVMESEDAPEAAARFVAAHLNHPDAVRRSREFVRSVRMAKGGEIKPDDVEQGADHDEAKEAKQTKDIVKEMTDLRKRLDRIEKAQKKTAKVA